MWMMIIAMLILLPLAPLVSTSWAIDDAKKAGVNPEMAEDEDPDGFDSELDDEGAQGDEGDEGEEGPSGDYRD